MSRSQRHNEPGPVEAAPRRTFRRRRVLWTASVCAVLALVLLGRGLCGQWCRYRAARDCDVWALDDAQRWLARAAWCDPRNAATELLRARCYRQLRDMPRRDAALALARQYGASRQAVQDEITLGNVEAGELGAQAFDQIQALLAAGASAHDVSAAYISGAIAAENQPLTAELLDAWERDAPQHPQISFLRGVLCALDQDSHGARAAYEQALAREPRHVLARLGLAQLDERENEFVAALERFVPLAAAHPENAMIAAGFARTLRKVGRLAHAQAVLEPFVAQPDVLPGLHIEMLFVELELGDYRAAKQRFEQTLADTADGDVLTAASIALNMLGETMVSEAVITWTCDRKAVQSQVDDLKAHLAVHPQDFAAAAQRQKALTQASAPDAAAGPYPAAVAQAAAAQQSEPPGRQLYVRHCSACHGPQGDGAGYAARHVFPRPRDLRQEPMRLVSTDNGVATRDDLRTVIQAGLPGTSMVPLDTLTPEQLDLLVDVTLEMRRAGVREQYVALLQADDQPVEDADVDEVVQLRTTPGAVVTVPDLGAPDNVSRAAGKGFYIQQACHACHGETGTGDELMPLFDTLGNPAFPRDLVHDVFKGGNDPASIYRRILLGMPGTPHPATVNLTTPELIALTHFCYTLGTEPKLRLTNHQRFLQAARRPAVQWAAPAP